MNPVVLALVLSLGERLLSNNGSSSRRSRRAKRGSSRGGGRFKFWLVMLLLAVGGAAWSAGPNKLKAIWAKVQARLGMTPGVAGGAGAGGAIRVYFTNPPSDPADPGDTAHAVVKYIDATTQTLDVCAFELDNIIITDALVRAVQRGVRVRLVTETDYLNENGVIALRSVGVPVVDDKRDGALMHNKFMVFDNKAVWTGSMNFTENCAYKNNNNGMYFDVPQLAENYATKFKWMFEYRKFGGSPGGLFAHIPNPVVTLPDGTKVENYFSTHDHCADHVIEAMHGAKRSIHFMAFSFTHDGIARAMLEKARAGVEVGGVFEKTQTAGGYSEYQRMASFGLPVFLDGNPRNMHHKVIVIDGEVVIAGSFNFSASADKSNDENLVIIHNPAVAKLFEEEYQRVLAQAKR
jgi:phosphatidylserine/phosphatidylglycerophosphate/cardiolipin synthase-like enzyme